MVPECWIQQAKISIYLSRDRGVRPVDPPVRTGTKLAQTHRHRQRDGRSVVADAAENAADGCLPAHAEDVVLDRLVRGTVVVALHAPSFVITLVPIRAPDPARIGSGPLVWRPGTREHIL